ncbi:MAG TPA: pyruvate ferredoxin oxidoreductase [Dehalococcoidia bacterium]|jgi:pyruvate ferredoxin oxidoreductase beta subunit|nr:thiamine pyrophosphate-dependent enzyme [SAR202 cluster bacterium]MDP6662457.1 thiamine pyrophosphate-dependent enzyme [SAR202 cluster bacterium]MQG58294.1 pyruvate ferredoxin oxidoreductase [SAR202 cluster bacterium]HAL46284.1 pyruvate ferredoxin oxidoreductase [Dehalococcoidia bacterium]
MRLNLRELSQAPELLEPGHNLCPGCVESVAVRQVLHVAGPNTVVVSATGCLSVSTTPYPYTSWKNPWIHSLFANAGATVSGLEAAYRSLVKTGRLDDSEPINFIVFGGDGGTYDIGFQSLSGALERGHRFLYVCINNEAYMNTGIQRSSATLPGTWTTTSPFSDTVPGKLQPRKDMTAIVAAHGVPYVAQTSPHLWKDLMRKVETALACDGPSFINLLAPCPRGWRTEAEIGIRLGALAVETCVWPIYEVVDGVWKLNSKPREKKPITEWLKLQGRFSHLMRPGREADIEHIQKQIDHSWESLLARCEASQTPVGV